jgi:putative protease
MTIAVGDKLRFSGATTNFEMKLESMQIDHEVVESAAAGADVGIAVPERVRRSDTVYRVSD